MKKKILDTIGMIIISIVIIIFSVLIGANEKGLRTLPMSILLFFEIIYLIVKKITMKEKIVIKNKVDICMLLFICSTLLPYIFKTYSTYQGTIEFIMKYFFIYATYLVIRNTIDSKKKVTALIYVTIISSFVIAFFAIDRAGKYYSRNILERLNLAYTGDYSYYGTFGYKNTLAIYFSFCIFLVLNLIQNSNKKIIKLIGITYILFAIFIIYKTLSRTVWLILFISLFIYFILYNKNKIYKHKKSIKKFITIMAIIMIVFISFVFGIGIKVSKPYELTEDYYYRKLNYKFKPNQNYKIKLEFDIGDISEKDNKFIEININEVNKYFNRQRIGYNKINLNEKNATLEFKTSKSVSIIDLEIYNSYKEKITINKCYINDKEYPINYKYLPYQLGTMLSSYSLGDESIIQRFDLWQDCIKMAKMSPIIGQGGNTWKVVSQAVQDYPYGMKESHSYFSEILISYGIIGIILLFGVIIFFYKDAIKNKQDIKFKLPILFGLTIVLLHSLVFDFNMSFVIILLLVYGYIGALLYDSKSEFQELKIIDKFIIIFLIIVLGVYSTSNISQYCIDDIKLKNKVGFYMTSYHYDYISSCIRKNEYYEDTLKEIQIFIGNEPYSAVQSEMYEKYWKIIIKNKKYLTEKRMLKYITFINESYRSAKFTTPMYINTILYRVNIMKKAYLELKNMNYKNEELIHQIEKLRQTILDEYNVNIVNIKDKERNHSSEDNINEIIKEYNKIIEELN